MSEFASNVQYNALQRVALALGSALVNWAEGTAQRTAALCPDDASRERRDRRAAVRRVAELRREEAIAALHLGPRGF